jgi:hypothetical protein
MFKRLLPVFLVTILLAGPATAQAAGVARTNRSLGVLKSQSTADYNHAPDQLRLDFGTVVRDTADEQSVGNSHGHGETPSVLQQQVSWDVPRWNWFFTWSWFSLMLVPR